MWVKICANTTLADALIAAAAGADAVGFVFARSPRQVMPQHVREIALRLPTALEKIGVFVDAGFDQIIETVVASGLTGVQLHCAADATLFARLRSRFAVSLPSLRIIQTLHFDSTSEQSAPGGPGTTSLSSREAPLAASFRKLAADSTVDAVLVDSRTATASGGTGVAFDWSATKACVAAEARLRIIVAGGLGPDNVGEAIRTLRPWGVDVATGVEASPGKKDSAKVTDFVQAARAVVLLPSEED